MRARSTVALCWAATTAAVLIASAGAGTTGAAAPSVELSSRASIVNYLRTIGVDPAGVVIQRGMRNYAGPSCPGRGWNCTRAARVVQVAQRAGGNKFECSGSSEGENDCFVVQESPAGNTARCTEQADDDTPVTQTCTISQMSVVGDNHAFVEQVIKQNEGSDQEGSQNASVTQTSGSGNNGSHVSQTIEQMAKDTSLVVTQSQHGRQRAAVDQSSATGMQDSHLRQSTDQDANASHAMGGTQNMFSDLFATVDQESAGISRNHNRQDEDQHASAPTGSAVSQTLIGPIYCCSNQGTDPRDRFDIDQSSTQRSTSPSAVLGNSVLAFCETTGICDVRQIVNQNGDRTNQTCSSPDCSIGITCVENECFPCEGADCFPECVECDALGRAFRVSARVLARQRF
jgi:hypothetical protein